MPTGDGRSPQSEGKVRQIRSRFKGYIELAESAFKDVERVGEKLRELCKEAANMLAQVEGFTCECGWENKLIHRVCEVIYAMSQNPKRFGLVDAIEKEIMLLVELVKKISAFVKKHVREMRLWALKLQSKLSKLGKRSYNDEIQKEHEEALATSSQIAEKLFKELEDYIRSSTLDIEHAMRGKRPETAFPGTLSVPQQDRGKSKERSKSPFVLSAKKRSRDSDSDSDSSEDEEVSRLQKTRRLEFEVSPAPSKSDGRAEDKKIIKALPSRAASINTANPPQPRGVRLEMRAQVSTELGEPEKILLGSSLEEPSDVSPSPLIKRKWSDDSDQTSSDGSPVAKKGFWLRRRLLH